MELLILLAITIIVTTFAALFCWIRAKRKKNRACDADSKFTDFSEGEITYIGDLSADDLFYISSPIKYKPNFTVEKFEN